MLTFLLKLIIAIASLVGLIFFIRYALKLLSSFDRFFTRRYKRNSTGLRWGIRLPTKAGELVEFYFYVILGRKHYMNFASWPVKLTLIISIFLFLAALTSRSFVAEYYTLSLPGASPYLSGGSILWYLHLVTLAYLVAFVLITIDSVKMMGYYAPLRVAYLAVVAVASVFASLLSFSLFITLSIFYLIFKVIAAIFGGRRRRYQSDRKPSILSKHYTRFLEVHNSFDHPDIVNEDDHRTRDKDEKRYYDDDINKLYAD
jgi:hypothetical protein